MSLEEDFRRKPNKNWLKAAFALKCLKEGIEPFVASQINQQHAKFLVGLQHSCNSCSLDTLLPPHALKVGLTCANGRQRCLCIGSKRTIRNACPNNICGTIYDRIVDRCVFCFPFWNNTDISKWTLDPWEIAKCYINIPGYKDKSSAHETDCLGLLTIIIHNIEFWNVISTVIDDKTDVFTKVKYARNQIMHSPTLEVTDSQLNDYVKDMITILEDPKHLKSDMYAVGAKTKLQKILQDDIYISTKDEIKLREEALKAIQEVTNESVRRITDMKSETLEEMNEIKDKHSTQLAGIQQYQTDLKADIQTIKERQTHIEERVDMLEVDISSLKEVKNTHQSQLEYLQNKLDVQTKLCEMYQQHLSTVPVSPILNDIEANVQDVFVDLVLCDDLLLKRKRGVDGKSCRIVKGYQDIFFTGKNLCKNIYLLADAGMGKTTWCLNFLRTWVSTVRNNTHDFADQKTCANFEIVVFISLRDVCIETEILDMIKNYLFSEDTRMFYIFSDVLRKEPEKCLIILDGLDEWNVSEKKICNSITQNPQIPSKRNVCGCTVLITSRKWKIYNIRLREPEFDKAIEIRGIKDQRSLSEKVIKSLNNINGWDPPKKYEDFEEALDLVRRKTTTPSFQLSGFMNVPLILISMVCIWCEKGKVEISFAANYLALVEVLIKHADILALGKECPLQEDNEDKPLLNGIGSKYDICRYRTVILKMSKIAFDASLELTSLVIDEQLFQRLMTKEELQTCLTLGFISQSKSVGKVLSRASKFSFLHKSLQEFLAAVHIVSESQNDNKTPMTNFKDHCCSFEKLSENENILLFVCGLDPRLGSELSVHISQLENITTEQENKLYITYTIPLKCIVQVHESDKGYPSLDFPIQNSKTCVTIDQHNTSVANYIMLLLQSCYYTTGTAVLTVRLNKIHKPAVLRWRPLTIYNSYHDTHLKMPDSFDLSALMLTCLTECSFIDIDLSNLTLKELTQFGQSFQRLTVLESLTLQNLYSSQSFIVNLLNCSNLKRVKAYHFKPIVILFSNAENTTPDTYTVKQSVISIRHGMSQPICSVREHSGNFNRGKTITDQETFDTLYSFVLGQVSKQIYDVTTRKLSFSFTNIPMLEIYTLMKDILRQYHIIKSHCVALRIAFTENNNFELSPLFQVLKKINSLRNYSVKNENSKCVNVTNSEFGDTHIKCKGLTCEEQKTVNVFLALIQKRFYAKTKTIDIKFDVLHETTVSALKSESLSTLNVIICSDEFSECRWLEMLNAIKQMNNLVYLNIHQNSTKYVDVRCEFNKFILGTMKNDLSSKVEMKGLSEKEENVFLSILQSHEMFKCETIKVFKVKSKTLKPAFIDLIDKMKFLAVLDIETSDSVLSENMLIGILNDMKYKKSFRDICVSDTTEKSLCVQHLCENCDGLMQCKNCLTGRTPVKLKLIKHTPSVHNAFICLHFMHNIAKYQSIREIEIACDTFQQSFLELIRLQSCPEELMVPMDDNDRSAAKWEKLLQNIGNLKYQSDIVLIDSNNTIFIIANYEVPGMISLSTFQTRRVFEIDDINNIHFLSRTQRLKAEESAKKQMVYLKIMRSQKLLYGAETIKSISINLSSDTLIQHSRTIENLKYLKWITMVDDVFNEATIRSGEHYYSIPCSTVRKRVDITCRGLSSEAKDTLIASILSLPMLKTHVVEEVNIVCSTFDGALLNLKGRTGSLKKLKINCTNETLTYDISLKLFRSLEKTSTLQYLYVQDKNVKTEETYAPYSILRDEKFMRHLFNCRQILPKKISIEVKEAFETFLKSHSALKRCIIQKAILV